MTDTSITTMQGGEIIESVLLAGDLSKLTAPQRVDYYTRVCKSIGLNPLTRPFDYITLNGKLTLYAKKDAADQLRRIYSISIDKPDIQFQDEMIIVSVAGRTPDGRSDAEIGVVNKKDMQGNMPNALMKAVTKAKRRLTLSICGLGWLDETEVETIPNARPVIVDDDGVITEVTMPTRTPAPAEPTMSLETAMTAQDSKGNFYHDVDSEKLSFVATSLKKSLAINGLSQEEHDSKQFKLDAIKVILASRQAA